MNFERVFVRMLFVVISGLLFSIGVSADPEWNGYALIAAKPLSADVKVNLSTASEVYAGEMYQVKLKVLDVVYGGLDKKIFNVDLFASHKEIITSKKKIYVLVEKGENALRGVSWATDRKIACFPVAAVKNQVVSEKFKILDAYTKSSCIAIE